MSIVVDRLVSDLFRMGIDDEKRCRDEKKYVRAAAYFVFLRLISAVYCVTHVILHTCVFPIELTLSLRNCWFDRAKPLYVRYSLTAIPSTLLFVALTTIRSIAGIFFAEKAWGQSEIYRWLNKKYMVVEFLQQTHYDVRRPKRYIHRWFTETRQDVLTFIREHNLSENFPLLVQDEEAFFQEQLPIMKNLIEIVSDQDLCTLDRSVNGICLSLFYSHLFQRLEAYRKEYLQNDDANFQRLRNVMKLKLHRDISLEQYQSLSVGYRIHAVMQQMMRSSEANVHEITNNIAVDPYASVRGHQT